MNNDSATGSLLRRSWVVIAEIAELINEALHRKRGRTGLSQLEHKLFWVWGKATLAIFESSKDTWRSEWAGFLKAMGTSSHNYDAATLTTTNTTYIKLSTRRTKAYVGATGKSLLEREAARRRTYRRRYPVNMEPSIRWWQQSRSFYEFVPIAFASHATKSQAYNLETAIHQVQHTTHYQTLQGSVPNNGP